MKLDINKGSLDKLIAFEGDNLLKNEVISLMQDGRIVDLTNLTCDMAYVDINNGNGDIIESLNISNPTNGEIELPINSNLTRKDGIYDCELRLKSSSNGYVKFTAFFSLVIKANVFNKIGNKILNNDSFSKIEEILNRADGYKQELDKKITTINLSITTAEAINTKLVNNTSTANTTNTHLESNIEEAKKTNDDSITKNNILKETINNANNINSELTSTNKNANDINTTLVDNINEAKKVNDNATNLKNALENDINRADTLKNDLETGINKANPVNSELIKNTSDAVEKNTTLNNSLNEAKKYISGLDGSQNIPQIRMDVDTLQNGLKANQELAYEGTNLKCENTFDGRIEDIVLEGRTLQNLVTSPNVERVINKTLGDNRIQTFKLSYKLKRNTQYTLVCNVLEYTGTLTYGLKFYLQTTGPGQAYQEIASRTGISKKVFSTGDYDTIGLALYIEGDDFNRGDIVRFKECVLLEGDWTNKEVPPYFEGIKSVGEEENKISILSKGKNLINMSDFEILDRTSVVTEIDKEAIHMKMKISQGWSTAGVFKLKVKPNTNYVIGRKIDVNVYGHGESSWGCGLITVKKNADQNNKSLTEISNPSSDFPNGNGSNYRTIKFNTGSCDYIGIFLKPTTSPVVSGQLTDVTISELFLYETSDNASKYESHKEDKKEILLNEGLKGLPSGVCDTLENREDGAYFVKRICKKVLDSRGDWVLRSDVNLTNGKIFGKYVDEKYKPGTDFINNTFISSRDMASDSQFVRVTHDYSAGKSYIAVGVFNIQSVEEFKTWLQQNPIEIYFAIAEPIETKISDTKISLDTYNALTYIFSNNLISPNIKAKVASNLGTIIQQNAKSINDIYKLIDEVLIPQLTTNTANIELLKLK